MDSMDEDSSSEAVGSDPRSQDDIMDVDDDHTHMVSDIIKFAGLILTYL